MRRMQSLIFENLLKIVTISGLLFLLFLVISVVVSLLLFTKPLEVISALFSSEVRFAISLSIITSIVSTLLSLLVGLPAAYALSRLPIKGKDVIDAIITIPVALPPIAIGAALLIFFTNTPLGISINRIINAVFEVPGIIVAQFSVITPYIVRLMKPVFDKIEPRYEMIARSFGYSAFEVFTKVTLPLAKTGILSAATLAWARAIGEFGATVTLAGATRYKTETLPIAIFLNLSQADIAKAMATILVLILVAFVAFIAIQKFGGGEAYY